ncbi:MAG: type III pantothenate kinase [Clostridia bacterium]
MLLTIDIGNTNITMGAFDGDELVFSSRMTTDLSKMQDQYAVEILNIFKLYNVKKEDFTASIISCVVPKLTSSISKAIKLVCGIDSLSVSSKLVPNLKVKDGSVSSLGADLIVGFVAAQKLYGCPHIVIDMGTATTVFVMDKDKFIRGGSILPGMRISLDALTHNASQLSSINLEAPDKVISADTASCIQSGMVYGTASMIDGLCERMEEELGYKCTIIATGGLANTVVPHCKKDIILCDNLLLDGLKIIYEENSRK